MNATLSYVKSIVNQATHYTAQRTLFQFYENKDVDDDPKFMFFIEKIRLMMASCTRPANHTDQ